ncbi:hypothetical protein I3842_04G185800 [Carya illinoinensis]|uniref:Cupin type-1 domain-containing protein n=1 Tax=Carya illinoinensis TaxID=32201 RepID=A0A922FE21_CARIL|nr:hypothetical protein I3842_04G185800 [Carya illinoinensis]
MGCTSEVQRYFMEEVEVPNPAFEICIWWKANSIKYPILSRIVRDVLAIPITTVASESTFSTGGRVLDAFQSSLSPSTMIFLALVLSLLVYASSEETNPTACRGSSQQCRLQRLRTLKPIRVADSEGGHTELWEESEDEFQCAAVAAKRQTVQPNSLTLPSFQLAPNVVYIEQGECLMGLTCPRCAETNITARWRRSRRANQQQKGHQIHRGDIVAIPAGVAHWCYNDGNEQLIAFTVMDLSNHANQLDCRFRSFLLAAGEPRDGQRGQRGSPQEESQEQHGQGRRLVNGLEETLCNERIRHNLDTQTELDVFSKQVGRVNIVNQHTLPILQHLDMSAEKGHIFPNALYTSHWSMTDNRVVCVLRGEARVQIVDDNRDNFYATTARAGHNDFEYVTIKTSGKLMKSPMAGYTLVIRAMPIDVPTNSFQMSSREAQNLKRTKGHQSFLLSSSRSS